MANRLAGPDETLIEHFGTEVVYVDPSERRAAREKKYQRLRLLWNKRKWLGKVALYGLAISLLIAWLIPTEYESTVRLMPPDQQSGSALESIVSMAGGGGGASRALSSLGGLLGGKTSGDLVLGVLNSVTVQDDLINKFNLRKVYRKRLWEDARDKLSSRTDTSVDKKSEIIKIVVTDRNAQRATAMAREYVDELNYVMSQVNTSSSHRERLFLEERLQQVGQNLEEAEKNFSQFASKNVALDIPEQGKAMLSASSQVEGQLIAAQTELQGLRQIYTDNNIRVRSTQARIAELQRQLNKVRGNAGPTDTSGTDVADSLEFPSIRKLPLLGVSYADLMRQTKVQEAVFEALTQQYELAKVNEAKELPSVKVLDPPQIPDDKSFPPRIAISIVGMILAFAGGIGWILLSERWKNVDPLDPGKSFATLVVADVVHNLPWASRNGSAINSSAAWNVSPDTASDSQRDPSRGAGRNSDS